MAERRVAVALLAAGSSRRFGQADKLAQNFHGEALGMHAARALPLDNCSERWVVVPKSGHPCEAQWRDLGLESVPNPRAIDGMGTSVALAARKAAQAGCDALLIALADMPFVARSHFEALLGARADIAVSALGEVRVPPALFCASHFQALSELSGDKGARGLLAKGEVIPCPPQWLIDIDTPEALQKYGQAGAHDPKPGSKGDRE